MSLTQLRVDATSDGMPLSRADFAEAEFALPHRYERSNGKLVVAPPAGYGHQSAGKPFRNHIGAYELAHPDIVEDVFDECWITLPDDTDRIADMAVYLRTDEARPDYPERIPELVYEVVSPGFQNRKRDYEEKRLEYEQAGIREYVIIDRFDQQVTVLRLTVDGFDETVLKPKDTCTTPLLPGLEIPLESIIGSAENSD